MLLSRTACPPIRLRLFILNLAALGQTPRRAAVRDPVLCHAQAPYASPAQEPCAVVAEHPPVVRHSQSSHRRRSYLPSPGQRDEDDGPGDDDRPDVDCHGEDVIPEPIKILPAYPESSQVESGENDKESQEENPARSHRFRLRSISLSIYHLAFSRSSISSPLSPALHMYFRAFPSENPRSQASMTSMASYPLSLR